MASIQQLNVRTIVKVLSDLKGGAIGFDPYRNPETNNKAKLLAYIVRNFDNAAIIAACERVQATEAAGDATATAAASTTTNTDTTGFPAAAEAAANIFGKQSAAAAPATDTASTEAAQIAALLAAMAAKGSVDAAKVTEICDARASQYVDNILDAVNKRLGTYDAKIAALLVPTIVEVKNAATGEVKSAGVQHRNFPDLLLACQAREASGNRLNIWLHGPAGTGKTHAAHAIADALALPFQSNGTLLTEHALSGFIDASGKYHRTAFREIFEHGGVYLGDEYDVWNPKAAMWLQAALANGYTRFPDGMIKRHPDCVIIFGANTTGKGATSEYSTRNKVDDANGNRVIFVEWPLDEALELAISPNPKWTARVQVLRARVEDRKLKGHMITPRQSMQGAALLAAGMAWDKVETMVLRRGLSDDQWNEIS